MPSTSFSLKRHALAALVLALTSAPACSNDSGGDANTAGNGGQAGGGGAQGGSGGQAGRSGGSGGGVSGGSGGASAGSSGGVSGGSGGGGASGGSGGGGAAGGTAGGGSGGGGASGGSGGGGAVAGMAGGGGAAGMMVVAGMGVDAGVDANGADAAPAVDADSADAGADAGPITTNGLALYLPFDETTGAMASDQSGNNNHGTLKGVYGDANAPTWEAGRRGNALRFNAVSPGYVTVAPSSSLDALTTAITVSAWVKTEAADWQAIAVRWSGSASDNVFHLGTTGGGTVPYRGEWSVWAAGSGTASAADAVTITAGAWVHLAGTYDGTTVRLYKNGALVASVAKTLTLPATVRPLIIGAMERASASGSEFTKGWKGLIDEVRIYNRALSDAEVQSLAQ